MKTYVMGHNEVAQIARAIPQHGIAVPETLAPKFRCDEEVQPGNEGARCKRARWGQEPSRPEPQRVNKNREFFRINVEQAKGVVMGM